MGQLPITDIFWSQIYFGRAKKGGRHGTGGGKTPSPLFALEEEIKSVGGKIQALFFVGAMHFLHHLSAWLSLFS